MVLFFIEFYINKWQVCVCLSSTDAKFYVEPTFDVYTY